MDALNIVCFLCAIVLVVGGINWALVGLTNYNLVTMSKNQDPNNQKTFPTIVYTLVGISALVVLGCKINSLRN